MSNARPLRRSLLFVPGGEPRKLDRARESGADTLLFDLEDSVAPESKAKARQLVAETLLAGSFDRCEAAVRVNAPGSAEFEDDLHAVLEAGARTLMLPKSERAGALQQAIAQLQQVAGRSGSGTDQELLCLALVESAAGVANLNEIGASPAIDALCFGHADFSLDMGLEQPDPSEGVVLHARCTVSIAARAAGLAAIDTVCLAVRDEDAFRADAQLGKSLGFEGKLCIHPSQVAIANEVFTPTAEQIEQARRVVSAWRDAQADGRGVFALDGQMIDAPVALAQSRLLERARRAGLIADAE